MTVEITYFVHGTTTDNEENRATGQAPGTLSNLGVRQASELDDEVEEEFDVVYCSDLRRADRSAKLAFGDEYDITSDERLRECDYGEMTQEKADWDLKDFIEEPYPDGESYLEVQQRIEDFLEFLKEEHDGEKVAIVAHQAPQLAIEVITENKSWEDAIEQDWREVGEWQPGWHYELEDNGSVWGDGDEETLKAIKTEDIQGKWLNLAAGDGRYTPELLEKVDKLVASDIDEEALNKLFNRVQDFKREKLDIKIFDLTEDFPFQDQAFDGVFCTGTLHLFEEETLSQTFSEIDRILKPDGKFMFDFATDISRISPNGDKKEISEVNYSKEEVKNIFYDQLSNFDIKWKKSNFEDDLTDNPEYGWKAKGNFYLVVADKKGENHR